MKRLLLLLLLLASPAHAACTSCTTVGVAPGNVVIPANDISGGLNRSFQLVVNVGATNDMFCSQNTITCTTTGFTVKHDAGSGGGQWLMSPFTAIIPPTAVCCATNASTTTACVCDY